MLSKTFLYNAIRGEQLDYALAQGMFRNGLKIFTTNFLTFNQTIYDAIWLRVKLSDFVLSKTQRNLIKRNSNFEYVVSPFVLNEERENLYTKYKEDTHFISSPSLLSLLYENYLFPVYDSHEVAIYDNGKLIGSGVFDLGKKSAAGIVSYFDPAYKKYSIGKLLITLKILYCIENKLEYFYPGYFAPGYKHFDYKLELAKTSTEFYSIFTNEWFNMSLFNHDNTPKSIIENKLNFLYSILNKNNIKSKIYLYQYFDSNLYIDFQLKDAFTYPYFILYGENKRSLNVIYYDIFNKEYIKTTLKIIFDTQVIESFPNVFNRAILYESFKNVTSYKDPFEVVADLKKSK